MSDINTNPITREDVYDIVRDSIGIPNSPINAACDTQMPTMEYLRRQQAEKAQYQAQGLLMPPHFAPAPLCTADISPDEREYQFSRYVEVLQEASRIRRDEALMKEIRAFIRRKRDEAATLLDEIG